jgi:hypothetical protein
LNHDKVAAANFRVTGFRPGISIVLDVLAATFVKDVEVQRAIIEALKDRDEHSRVDRATGVNGLVVRQFFFTAIRKTSGDLFGKLRPRQTGYMPKMENRSSSAANQ